MKVQSTKMNSAKSVFIPFTAVVAAGIASQLLLPATTALARSVQTKVQPLIMGQNYYQQYENQQVTLSANSINVLSWTSWLFGAITGVFALWAGFHFAKK